MEMPIIVDENGDVSIYWTLEDAKKALEPIDVKNDEYIAYDGLGRLLLLEVISPYTITIQLVEYEPNHLQQATVALKNFIAVRSKKIDIENLSLVDLINVAKYHHVKN